MGSGSGKKVLPDTTAATDGTTASNSGSFVGCGYLSIDEARELLPGKPSRACVGRWCMYGLDGLILKSILSGRRRFTRREWIETFIRSQNETVKAPKERASVKAPRLPSHDAAVRELTAAGLMS